MLATFFVVIGVRLKKESAAIEKEDEPKIPETDLDFYRDIENVYSLLSVEQIEMEFGYSIVQYIDSPEKSSFMDRVVMLRKQIAAEYGFVIPSVRLRDNIQLSPGEYVIKIKGEQVAKGRVLSRSLPVPAKTAR